MNAAVDDAAPGAPGINGRRAALLGGLLAVAGAVRFWRLGAQPLWLDEASTWAYATRDGLAQIVFSEYVHPPLHKLLVAGWARLVGESEAALRALPALFGVLTVWAVYGLCRECVALERARRAAGAAPALDDDAGLALERWPWVAATLAACSPFLVYYSQELRMYALLALLAVASFWSALRWLRLGWWRDAWALGLLGLLGLYTHYFYAFSLLGVGGVLAWAGWRVGWAGAPRRVFGVCVAGALALGAVFAPWALAVLEHAPSVTRWQTPLYAAPLHVALRHVMGPALIPVDAQRAAAGFGSVTWGEGLLAAVTLVVVGWGMVRAARLARRWRTVGVVLLGGGAAPALIVLLAVHPFNGLYKEHYLIATCPLVLMALALALVGLTRRGLALAGAALGGVMLAGLGAHLVAQARVDDPDVRFGKEQWRQAVALIDARGAPDATLLLSPAYLSIPVDYYDRGAHRRARLTGSRAPDEEVAAALDALGAPDEVWLVLSHPWERPALVDAARRAGWRCVEAHALARQWGVRLYALRRVGAPGVPARDACDEGEALTP